MKKNKVLFFIFWSVVFILFIYVSGNTVLSAQSNVIIDDLLNEEEASFGRAAYLVLEAAADLLSEAAVSEKKIKKPKKSASTTKTKTKTKKLTPEETVIEKALMVLEEKGWMSKIKKESQDAISLGEFSYIIMKAFNINGGIMYSIFQSPRYACRELSYLGFIIGCSSPYRSLSGEESVIILGRVLEWLEEKS